MKICFIGTGYVGLVSGVCFADLGYDVTCVDNNRDKIEMLNKGMVPIYEPGLDQLIANNVQASRLQFSLDLKNTVAQADIVFIAVGTPPSDIQGKADLSYVYAAAEEIADALEGYTVVVTKSTVPVGTNAQIADIISTRNPKAEFDVASNPEFLREGSAIGDFMKPDRIVVGTQSAKAAEWMAALYQPLVAAGFRLLQTGLETAEMIKYASNSFLATKIAFINEMADICEQVGANVELVAKGMGMDARIGERFLRPGPGFGGSCFPKDAMALAQLADEVGVDPRITNTVIRYNLGRRESMAERVITACSGNVSGKRIAILGLTFKANTDDMRESPALCIIPTLLEAGATLSLYDPQGMDNAKILLPQEELLWTESALQACAHADAVVIVTEWEEFAQMDLAVLRHTMHNPLMIDLRNLFIPSDMAKSGFTYYSIGRKPASPQRSEIRDAI